MQRNNRTCPNANDVCDDVNKTSHLNLVVACFWTLFQRLASPLLFAGSCGITRECGLCYMSIGNFTNRSLRWYMIYLMKQQALCVASAQVCGEHSCCNCRRQCECLTIAWWMPDDSSRKSIQSPPATIVRVLRQIGIRSWTRSACQYTKAWNRRRRQHNHIMSS